jgi:hypothetical protein
MAKSVPTAVMDAALDYVAASTLMSVVSDSSTPTNLTNTLASVAMASGDFTKAQGDAGAGSRKVTMGAKSGVSVTATGDPNHVCLSLTGTIRMITTSTGPGLTSGSTVDFPAWKYELGVPT